MFRRAYRTIRSGLLHSLIPESQVPPFERGQGIEVVGLFHNASGLGESARLCATQLKSEGYKVRCTSVENFLLKHHEIGWEFEDTAGKDEIGLRIIHLNPPMIPPYALRLGLKKFASVYNIGYWAWELEKLPREWTKSLNYINAVMGPSDFTASTMRHYTSKPVFTLPHPVTIRKVTDNIRERIGIGKDDFLICSVFALESSLERKNPQALVNAFLEAFGDKPDAYLVFKISKIGDGKAELLALSKDHKNIRFIDDVWPREDILGLIKTADVYASLHHAEGFGLCMAEAMLLGTPVVATNWSGNVDFCHEENSFPVGYSMVPVRARHSEFARARNSVWAEADVHQAAAILRQIYEDPSLAKKKAEFCMTNTNQKFSQPRYEPVLTKLNDHVKKVVLVTAHDYDSPRKTGFYFWAKVLTEQGKNVDWLTVGLSSLTFLKKDARQYAKPFNTWLNITPHLKKYVWCPLFHPSNFNNPVLNWLTFPLFSLYARMLPEDVKRQVKDADVFIIESGAGPLLVPTLKKLCPRARFIYNFSDRFNVVKWHPVIPWAERKTLPLFDLIRTNAAATVEDFPKGINVQYIPQAIEKDLFDNPALTNPYTKPKNAISVGDMLFDAQAIETLARKFPDWTFHLFGKKSVLDHDLPNVVAHGEVSFADLVPYLRFADVGLAPYKDSPDADYLSHSSLKLVQYTWCRLPIVAPDFAAKGRDHVMAYNAADVAGTIEGAFAKAVTYDRGMIDRSHVLNWEEFLQKMLSA